MTRPRLLLLALALVPGCASTLAAIEPSAPRVLENASGRSLDVDGLAERLAAADVVFLGETHDSDEAHRLQLLVFERLLERREHVILSLEMLERDVQPLLDAWLAGAIDEEAFLAGARPWPNWSRHYRPLALLARERGVPVLAANVPRPLAAQVHREGLSAVDWNRHVPRATDAGPGEYRRRFEETMGGNRPGMDDFFAAQCLKDDAMAESIADAIGRAGRRRPLVVHLCGRFHSDWHLGTVERLRRRAPDLTLTVVTTLGTVEARKMGPDQLAGIADFTFVVHPTAPRTPPRATSTHR
jgi:uncharacterized iron-regulated protein